MKLTIATVVRNDLHGLRQTLESVSRLIDSGNEYVVVDGSTDRDVRGYLAHCERAVVWTSEPDDGIYDAMNKALDRATGDYILFINAGDRLHPQFDWRAFFARAGTSSQILIGRVIEVAGEDRYLRPGVGREETAFDAPPHQATFYPRAYYSESRYRTEQRIGADGTYTLAGIDKVGATFVSATVAEFYVGGVSSTYGRWRTIKQRFAEATSARDKIKIGLKTVMWYTLSRRDFYRILASYNRYTNTTLQPAHEIAGGGRVLHRVPKSSNP